MTKHIINTTLKKLLDSLTLQSKADLFVHMGVLWLHDRLETETFSTFCLDAWLSIGTDKYLNESKLLSLIYFGSEISWWLTYESPKKEEEINSYKAKLSEYIEYFQENPELKIEYLKLD